VTALCSSSTKYGRRLLSAAAAPALTAPPLQVPKWLAVKDMPTSLSLELLDAALQCQPAMIKSTPQLLQVRAPAPSLSALSRPQVVQSRLCPVLQSMMLKPPPFPVCIRCMRLVSRCAALGASPALPLPCPPHAEPAASSSCTA
jgi:hypothetical protein